MYKILSAKEKRRFAKRVLSGVGISQVSREARVSRTIVYKWVRNYVSVGSRGREYVLSSKIRKGKRHWKAISKRSERTIIRVALQSPAYSP